LAGGGAVRVPPPAHGKAMLGAGSLLLGSKVLSAVIWRTLQPLSWPLANWIWRFE
jgi:hypothetical protein